MEKTMRILAVIAASLTILYTFALGKSCLILPLTGQVLNGTDRQTVQDLFVEAFIQAYPGKVTVYDGADSCRETSCARELGRAGQVDEVAYLVLRRLGESIIVSGKLLSVAATDEGQPVRLTTQSIEDMAQVAKRLAEALATGQTVDQTVTTENIVAVEKTDEPARRQSMLLTGFSIGYLYPLNNTYSGVDILDNDTTEVNYSQFIKLNWKSWYEFRENMAFSVDAHWLTSASFGATFNYHYLFSTKDFTPYAITGLGLEYVYNDKFLDDADDSKRHSGPMLNAGLGYLGFRTYDIHFFLQAAYSITFNSDLDNGVVLELGSVYRPAPKPDQKSESVTGFTKVMIGCGALLILTMIIGSVN
jgi:hypothetical protein